MLVDSWENLCGLLITHFRHSGDVYNPSICYRCCCHIKIPESAIAPPLKISPWKMNTTSTTSACLFWMHKCLFASMCSHWRWGINVMLQKLLVGFKKCFSLPQQTNNSMEMWCEDVKGKHCRHILLVNSKSHRHDHHFSRYVFSRLLSAPRACKFLSMIQSSRPLLWFHIFVNKLPLKNNFV